MAGTINVNLSVQATNGNFQDTFNPGQNAITQDAVGFHGPVVTVGTTEEVVPNGDISTLGVFAGRNLDTTNFVTMGASTGGAMYPFQRIEAGESFVFRREPGTILRWKADTSAVQIQMKLFED